MSTHRRAWMIRAGVVAVVAAAGLFGIASPAFAADPQLSDISLDPSTVQPGGETTVRFVVKMSDGNAGEVSVVSVTSSNPKVTCSSTCSFANVTIPASGKDYQIKFRASGTFSGDESATLTIKAGGAQNQQQLNVDAPQQAPQGVPEVSGTVVDAFTNKPIEAAKVYMQDSKATNWEVGTDSKGNFKITSRPEKPIVAGTLAFRVEKDGIEPYGPTTKTGNAGQPLTGLRFAVRTIATTGPAASADASVTAGTPDANLAAGTEPTSQNEQESSLSWILIAVGGLLVLLGIGAIVLLFVRKRDDGEGDDDGRPRPRRGGPPSRGQPPGGRPPGRMQPPRPMRGGPGHDATRPLRPPVSPGPRSEQTMIAPSPLANAQTQLHRVPADQTDPYGRQNAALAGGGYGQPPYGAAGGYGQPPTPGYAAPHPPSAYPGGAPPSYGEPESYGQPYGQGYGQPPGYGQQQDPYGPQGGYEGYPPKQMPDPRSPDPRSPDPRSPDPRSADPRSPDPRGHRSSQPPDSRRVDWLDD